MTVFNQQWSDANQLYLVGMIDLIKKQLEHKRKNFNAEDDEYIMPDISSELKELDGISNEMSSPPAIITLCSLLGLSPFERDIILLCAGVELDAGLSDLIASIQGDASLFQPTFGLALAVFKDAHWSAISPANPLRYWRLIDVNKGSLITRAPIKIDEHILHYLTGINTLNERLKEVAEPIYLKDELVRSQQELAELILQSISQKTIDHVLPVIHLGGTDKSDKLAIASYVSVRQNSLLFSVSAYAVPLINREITELTRLWNREAALNGYVMFLDCTSLDINDKQRVQSLISFIENLQGLVIMNSDHWTPDLRRNKVVFDVEKPTPSEQMILWESVISKSIDPVHAGLEKIVSQFNLNSNIIRKAGFEIFNHFPSNGKNGENNNEELKKNLWKICCRHTRPQVDELAERIEPVASWDDIVLPAFQKNLIKEIAAQVKQRNKVYDEWGFAAKGSRGLGISALFAGESGTGKTMASEVLANELGLDLYKIDLSKVVNKYIGETEKNLKKIFDAAEEGGAILLFDEADALFGKRSDVKDSHDRYSNIEVSYLLQRMEAYRGLAILTTNMKNALDKAFLRRIRFVVHFPFPDAIQRAEIWSKVFPSSTPKNNLDLEKLSKLSIPGGSIRNIALNAAFFAADENNSVEMMHIFRAAKSEYEKAEKPFNHIELKTWQ